MFFSATNKLSQKFHFLDNLHIQHKLMLFSLVLIFAAIPITTIGIINIRSIISNASVSTVTYLRVSDSNNLSTNNPTFSWSCYCVPSYFEVQISEAFSFATINNMYWKKTTSSQSTGWSNGAGWTGVGLGSAPTTLTYGTVDNPKYYYWKVKACDGSTCTSSNVSTFNLKPPNAYNHFVTSSNCNDVLAPYGSTPITFSWTGRNAAPADYWVDWSTFQNPSGRWNSGNFSGLYAGSNTSVSTRLPINTVIYWRVWNTHRKQHTYPQTKAFVPCSQTSPGGSSSAGSPIQGYISSEYGGGHPLGIDIAGGGKPVYATMAGTAYAIACCPSSNLGNNIELYNPSVRVGTEKRAMIVKYGHLASFSNISSSGTVVYWGRKVGTEGNTGFVTGQTGVHVHMEVISAAENTSYSTLRNNQGNSFRRENPSNFNIFRYNGTNVYSFGS